MRDVQIVVVTPIPTKVLPSGIAPDLSIHAVAIKHLLFGVAEISADYADNADIGEKARREREVRSRAAQHLLAFSKRRLDCVERHRTDYKKGHEVWVSVLCFGLCAWYLVVCVFCLPPSAFFLRRWFERRLTISIRLRLSVAQRTQRFFSLLIELALRILINQLLQIIMGVIA